MGRKLSSIGGMGKLARLPHGKQDKTKDHYA